MLGHVNLSMADAGIVRRDLPADTPHDPAGGAHGTRQLQERHLSAVDDEGAVDVLPVGANATGPRAHTDSDERRSDDERDQQADDEQRIHTGENTRRPENIPRV
jgi:hypothetical protein